ncbi:uncharacterized protein PRCAT00006216001 [Priceomyces carsonii]|uniref:uncharacterized protein n=1 Tax=Priceomyces carsonii TaxID=28549 RepID=UPI002ED90703|nr:unnamed protein product [Priceomyces carsonii]
MDLLLLGSESRKTHIRPRKNLRRDKYDMEDIDEFFEEDEEDIEEDVRNDDDQKETSTLHDNINNVARKINFTDAEASKFDLSPISISKYAARKNKKSPLRSPLPEHNKGNQEIQGTFIERDEEEILSLRRNDEVNDNDNNGYSNNDLNDFDDIYMELSPVDLSPMKDRVIDQDMGEEVGSKIPSEAVNRRSVSSLTKNMALGATKRRRPSKRVVSLDDESEEEVAITGDSSELLSPPPTDKKRSGRKPGRIREINTKPSPLPSPPPDGLRRSKRTRIAPLAYWRNERIVYSRAKDNEVDPDTTLATDIKNIPLQEIKEVVHIPEVEKLSPPTTRRSRLRSRTRKIAKKSQKEIYDYESDPEISGSEWFQDKTLNLEVYEDPENEIKVERTIAWAPNGGSFQEAPNKDGNDIDNFKVATLFNYNRDVTACGLLEFPFEGFKSLRNSGDCIFDFHVVKGLIEVMMNNDKFVVTRGCSFEIPNANIYGFKNIGQGNAKLFFVQTRVPATDEVEAEL